MEQKYRDKLEVFMSNAKANNKYSDEIVGKTLLFSNIWSTLISPILIGLGISYLFGLSDSETVHIFFYLLAIIFLSVHLAAAYIVHQNNSKFSLYSQAIDLKDDYSAELADTRSELAQYKHTNKTLSNLYSNQMTSLFITSNITDQAVGNINKLEGRESPLTSEEFRRLTSPPLASIIRTLSLERELLFGYQSKSLFNICLYMYDDTPKHLYVLHRDCDSRLPQRNRKWTPGHGHVGLAFLHKQTKLCPDILKSNELSNNALENEDNRHYRSFISIPILRCDDNGDIDNGINALGVLVLTSSTENQFDENRDLQFLNTISKHLAIYLSALTTYIIHNPIGDEPPLVAKKDVDNNLGESNES